MRVLSHRDAVSSFTGFDRRIAFGPERLGVPGFRSGTRYRSVSGRRRYFAFYETERMAILNSEAYRTRLDNPTAWTRRIMPEMRNAARSAFELESAPQLPSKSFPRMLNHRPHAGEQT